MMAELSPAAAALLSAAGGALAIELLKLSDLRSMSKEARPNLRDLTYWLPYLILPLVGAGLAGVYLLSDIMLRPIVALNIGISAPLMLRMMATSLELAKEEAKQSKP